MTSLLFGSPKKEQEQVPEPPTLDQLVSDLEVAGPDDIVFNADVTALLDNDKPTEIPKRFSNQTQSSLYDKVIHHNQNVKRVAKLKSQLPEIEENLSQLKEELQEDRKRVTTEYKKAAELHKEVTETTNNKQLHR